MANYEHFPFRHFLLLKQTHWPEAGIHLVSQNYFSVDIFICVFVCVSGPEAINNQNRDVV